MIKLFIVGKVLSIMYFCPLLPVMKVVVNVACCRLQAQHKKVKI